MDLTTLNDTDTQANGLNGADGQDGATGPTGANGLDGVTTDHRLSIYLQNGANGLDGTDTQIDSVGIATGLGQDGAGPHTNRSQWIRWCNGSQQLDRFYRMDGSQWIRWSYGCYGTNRCKWIRWCNGRSFLPPVLQEPTD